LHAILFGDSLRSFRFRRCVAIIHSLHLGGAYNGLLHCWNWLGRPCRPSYNNERKDTCYKGERHKRGMQSLSTEHESSFQIKNAVLNSAFQRRASETRLRDAPPKVQTKQDQTLPLYIGSEKVKHELKEMMEVYPIGENHYADVR